MTETILKVLEGMATQLRTTAGHLWGVLVRQAIVEGCMDGGLAILGLILLGIGYKIVRDPENDSELRMMIGIGMLCVGFLTVIFLYAALGELINPEFWALTTILGELKK